MTSYTVSAKEFLIHHWADSSATWISDSLGHSAVPKEYLALTKTELEASIESVESGLQQQINNIISNTDSAALDSLSEIVSAFQAGDTSLNQFVSTKVGDLEEADNTLQNNLNAEETARVVADDALQGAIDAEETARVAADDILQANINAEETARVAADNALQSNIEAETEARFLDISNVYGAIGAETEARFLDISNVYGALNNVQESLTQNINAEETARVAADNALQSAIDAEETDRVAAVNTLQSAIDAEASARETADGNLQSQISENLSKIIGHGDASIQLEMFRGQSVNGLIHQVFGKDRSGEDIRQVKVFQTFKLAEGKHITFEKDIDNNFMLVAHNEGVRDIIFRFNTGLGA